MYPIQNDDTFDSFTFVFVLPKTNVQTTEFLVSLVSNLLNRLLLVSMLRSLRRFAPPKLTAEEIVKHLGSVPKWQVNANGKLARNFVFKDFNEAFGFMTRTAVVFP